MHQEHNLVGLMREFETAANVKLAYRKSVIILHTDKNQKSWICNIYDNINMQE